MRVDVRVQNSECELKNVYTEIFKCVPEYKFQGRLGNYLQIHSQKY